MSEQTPFQPLHPRAIRIGLNRVLENQEQRPREFIQLQQIYTRVMAPPTLTPQEQSEIADWLQAFQDLEDEAAREALLERYLRGGKS